MVDSGVPQGSVLGPILFLIYVDDAARDLDCKVAMFADDMKIWSVIRGPADEDRLQMNLNLLEEWSDRWILRFNVAKRSILRLGNTARSASTRGYFLGGAALQDVEAQRDLGVLMTSSLKPSVHCSRVAKSAMSVLPFSPPPILSFNSDLSSLTFSLSLAYLEMLLLLNIILLAVVASCSAVTDPAPLAVCRFDNADTCGWINDFNNWRQRWTIVKTAAWSPRVWTHTLPALCLTTAIEAPRRIPQQEASSSWIPISGMKKPKTSGLPPGGTIQARFWSPSIPAELGLKCLQLAYHVHLGQHSPAEPPPAHSPHIPRPLHVWTFNEMDLGDWTNDANNWRQKWTVLAAPASGDTSPALCLLARTAPAQPTRSQAPWLAARRRIQEPSSPSAANALSARLWSPPIPADVGMRCLAFSYSLHLGVEAADPADISLALLQRQEG
nr:unnamed protein product [Spirometra erinaceieuropaei]